MTGWLVAFAVLVQAPTVPAPPPSAVVQPATAPQSTEGDLWLVIYSVLPTQTTQFEAVARQVRAALSASPEDVRRTQGRELRIHRSAVPNADGRILYFLQVPALTGDADRSGLDVLIDAVLPTEASSLKAQLTAALDPSNPSGNTYLINVR